MAIKKHEAEPVLGIHYGRIQARGPDGGEAWRGHNGGETWSDGGQSERVVEAVTDELHQGLSKLIDGFKLGIVQDMQDVIGNQVRDAVGEYVAAGEFTLSVRDNEVSLFFEIANEAASIRCYEHLGLILSGAIKQAKNDAVFRDGAARLSTAV